MCAGASAGYVFLNALFYWARNLNFGSFTSGVLYVGYSALLSFLFLILTGEFAFAQSTVYLLCRGQRQIANGSNLGTIGFFSSWAFVHRIYGSIKID